MTACREAPKPPIDTTEQDDHARLAKIVAADEALDRALKAADDVSRAGDDAKGATMLETDATRAADDAVAEAKSEPLVTAWGKARRDKLLSVLEERRASIPSYAEAMRGEELDSKLLVLTFQIDLQKRAIEAATAALAPTPALAPATAVAQNADAG